MPKLLRPAAPRLIRSHPLAVGLADAVLLNGDRGWNYGTEAVQPAFFGSMAAEPTADSPGSRASGGTNYATLSPSYNIAAGVFTVSVLWKPVSNSSQFTTMLEKANGGSREWAFFVNYSFSLGNISYYTIGTSLSGDVNLATAMTAGGTYRFTVTRDTSGLMTLYVNGVPKATTTNATTTAVAGSAWQIGRAVSGAANPDGVYGDLFVWPSRMLSADEVMQHAAEPWAMLRPRGRLLKAASGYSLSVSPQAYQYAAGAVGLSSARTMDAATLAYGYAAQAVGLTYRQGAHTLDVEPLAYRYRAPNVELIYNTPATGDTHDGWVKRSRRERRLEALRQRRDDERLADAQALRATLEAALDGAEAIPAPKVVAAVQAAPKPAAVDWKRVAERDEDYVKLSRAVARLSAVVDAEAKRRADDEDDEDAIFLMGAV